MERSEKAFKEFLDLCREVTNNDTVVLELLQKRYNRTNLHFLWSNDFPDLIERCSQKIKADRDNKYVHIKEFTTELKAYKAKPLKHLRDTRATTTTRGDGGSQVRRADACPELEPPMKRPRLSNDDSCNVTHRTKQCSETMTTMSSCDKKVTRQVQTASCTLIPLTLMCNGPSASDRDPGSTGKDPGSTGKDHGSTGVAENGDSVSASKIRRALVTAVKVSEVGSLGLPELQVVLEKSNVEMDRSLLLQRRNVAESSSSSEDEATDPSVCRKTEEDVKDRRIEKHIEKLELLLKKISDEIKQLQETELSLEDLDKEDSSYTLEDRYKKRFVKVWNRLCELKGRDTTTGREVERKLNYCGTNYPEVNKSISRFVNKFRVFPDYSDIHEIIARSNRKHGLGIRKAAVDRLARETFTDVGNILQKRRMADHVENFGCHLTENVKSRDDPALFDSRLKQRLDENSKISKTNLDEILSRYAQKQDEEPGESTQEETQEEEEEEEVDEEDKTFMEDMEQIEEIVLTDGSTAEEEEEDGKREEEKADGKKEEKDGKKEEELKTENGSKEKEDGAYALSVQTIEKTLDVADIDLCTDKSLSESLSLLNESFDNDEFDDLPLTSHPVEATHSTQQHHPMRSPLQSLSVEIVESSENNEDKGRDFEREKEREEEEEEERVGEDEDSLDVRIVPPPPSSSVDVPTLPPHSTHSPSSISLSSTDVIHAKPLSISLSPPPSHPFLPSSSDEADDVVSRSTSVEVEPVDATVPPSTVPLTVPVDVICVDDETNSPFKSDTRSTQSGSSGTVSTWNGTSKKTDAKGSALSLALLRLTKPCDNAMLRFAKGDASQCRKALSLRQPTTNDTASSDEEDVIEIMSVPAPDGSRGRYGNTTRQEVRRRMSVNRSQSSSSSHGHRNSAMDECCVVTTVEESVVSTVVTSRDERSANGVRGQQVEMRQHTKKTMRVVGQIVRVDPYAKQRMQPRMQATMRVPNRPTLNRVIQANQHQAGRSFVGHSPEMNRSSGTGRPVIRSVIGQTGRGGGHSVSGHVTPSASSLTKQLDDISSQIASSIFKNRPPQSMTSSSSDADVIICDDASPSIDVTTVANRSSKANGQKVNRVNTTDTKATVGQRVKEATGRASQASRSLVTVRSERNGACLPPKPTRSLHSLPEVIDLV